MNDLITTSDHKSFWSKPEGKTGMIVLAVAAGGLIWALPWISMMLGTAIAVFGKLMVLGAMAAVCFILLTFASSTTCHLIFRNLSRKLLSLVIDNDPIGVMKTIIEKLKSKKEEMDKNISQLRGTISVIEGKAAKAQAGYDDAMRSANVARSKGAVAQFSLKAKSADRMEKSTTTYQQMAARMTVLYRALKKYQEATEITIIDMTEEVAVKSDERDSIIAANKAMNGAMSILKGAGPEMDIFNEAMEFTVKDSLMKVGEIEDFMLTTKSIIEGMDLQQGVYDEKAMEKLAAWEAKADSLVLGGEKRLMLESVSPNTFTPVMNNSNVGVTMNADYSKYFDKQ